MNLLEAECASWERLPGEPALWYERFRSYLFQGPPRSLVAVYRGMLEEKGANRRGKKPLHEVETIPGYWSIATRKFRWRERVTAFDAAEHARQEREWAAARRAERETEMQIAAELRKKAYELLALPIVVETIKRDRHGQDIAWLLVPEFRAFLVASHLFAQAMKHARNALEMPDHYNHTHIVGKEGAAMIIATPPVGMTEVERLEKLRTLAQRVQGGHV
jgi:hypothetical protein